MTYMLETQGYQSSTMDLPRFAADLAKELGATVMLADGHNKPTDEQRLDLGKDQLRLYYPSYSNRDRTVHVSICAPDVPWNICPTYGDQYKAKSARVNPEKRSIAAIAKDIKRRVIDASGPALTAQREYVAQVRDRRSKLTIATDELKAAFPELDLRRNEDNTTIYGGGESHYINARLEGDGDRVTIDRLGSLTIDQFKDILRVLNKREQTCQTPS